MMFNSEINKKVKATIDSVESIKDVNVSPFLKDRILQNIAANDITEKESIWSWFTPSLQLATLILFMALNVYAYINLNTDEYNSTIDDFAETYGFSESTDTSIFN